ncbi:phosphoglycerate mutase-like protein [Mycena rosella]|uniref:Phosphoglycerate mutase-like protein n=1 Tax=Mycena rosella TaxID=1033263 RepID=A0AAD7G040_MYCRO|nr:phosphoglycerate mutase-like protein [Mycena rosella]
MGLSFYYAFLVYITAVSAAVGSSFAGSTSTALFPPANATITATDTFFPNASQVGHGGPTPTGDEAAAIATAPAVALVDNVFPLVKPATSDKKPGFDILQHLGNLSPFQSVKSLGLPDASARVPDGCKITQVHLLHRHGARYPTGGSSFAAALHTAATSTGFNTSGPLAFLSTWTYKLGEQTLTPFGRAEMFNLGVGFRVKYGDLLKKATDLPVFRTTSEERMVDSALNFAAGFFGVQSYKDDYHQLIEIDDELGKLNSTLAPWNCPVFHSRVAGFGSAQALKWANIYLVSARERLSPSIQGLVLDIKQLIDMQTLCAYETVALGYSAFCGLFTEEEWKGYEYYVDLHFWYGFGPGAPYASAMGLGWVQELISRLTQTRITNFDSTPVTFPFGQPIYVDATHEIVVSQILTALNFTTLAANGPLPTDRIPPNQTWFANQLVPFGTNLVGQVLSCPASDTPTHIRWILNDAVLHRGIKQRIAEINFEFDCFGNYTTPNPDNIIDGRYPQSAHLM